MLRLRIDPETKYGRYFRPVAAALIVILAIAFAVREARSPDHDTLALVALVAAALVGATALMTTPRNP